jgi:hypothetical protein
MVQNAVRDVGDADDFVGHLSGTEFVLVTVPNHIEALEERIRTRLEQSLDYFYPVKDREKGLLPGKRLRFQIGRVDPEQGPFDSINEMKTALLRSSV